MPLHTIMHRRDQLQRLQYSTVSVSSAIRALYQSITWLVLYQLVATFGLLPDDYTEKLEYSVAWNNELHDHPAALAAHVVC
jgi:hypothetical protein